MNYPPERGRLGTPVEEQIAQEEQETQEGFSLPKDLDNLLEMAELLKKKHNLSDEEVERLLEIQGKFKGEQEYLESLLSGINIDDRYIGAIGKKILSSEPPADYLKDFHDEIVSQEMVSEVEKARIEHLYSLIGDFEDKKYLTDEERTLLIKLQEKKEEVDAKLSAALVEKREEIQKKYIGYYKDMANSLLKLVEEIEGYPQVKAALEQRSEEEKRHIETERMAAEKARNNAEALQWTELHQLKDNLIQRNENAIQEIEGLVGRKGFIDELRQALQLEDKNQCQSAFDRAWSVLEKVMLEGEKRVAASDIYPWAKPGPNYKNSLYFLEKRENIDYLKMITLNQDDKRSEKADGALSMIRRIREDNLLLFALLGNFLDKKGKFSRAIGKRKEYEQKGIIKILNEKRKELEGKRETYEKEASEIVASGGFEFEIPRAEDIKGERIQIGYARGGLKLVHFEEEQELKGETRRERRQINKGKGVLKNDGWKVESVGGYNFGVKVGDMYETNFSNAPSFVKRVAKIWAKRSGLMPEKGQE